MTLNPRDYKSFEDYLQALKEHDAFDKRIEQVGDILNQGKSEIEEKEEMKKL